MAATATATEKTRRKRVVNQTHDDTLVAQRQQARSSRQQAADACVDHWNEVLAAEGSFADEHSTL